MNVTTNVYLDPIWTERVRRLRLGIAPVDLAGQERRLTTLECFSEDVPRPFRPRRGRAGIDDSLGLPRLRRTMSARHAISFGESLADLRTTVVVRLVDRDGRFVPRRLALPVPTEAQVVSDNTVPRRCRPVMFPSVRYGVPAGATLIRGRVTWATGDPVCWGRILVRPTGSTALTWLGQTDLNGEYVVVLGAVPVELVRAAGDALGVDLTVSAPSTQPSDSPVDALTLGLDPLRHLPVEVVAALSNDPVLDGTTPPNGYVDKATTTLSCTRGTVTQASPVVLN